MLSLFLLCYNDNPFIIVLAVNAAFVVVVVVVNVVVLVNKL